jgi:deoxyribose-phosphate aldolase
MKNTAWNNPAAIAAAIDHTLLKPGILLSQVIALCQEAKQYGFASVCIPPLFVNAAKKELAGSPVKVATVIGFPFGYSAIEAKLAEILLAVVDGADELDMVANFTAIKNNDWDFVANEINHIMPIIAAKNKVLKVIIESGVLTDNEIIKCCELYGAAGIHFLKTSTGYAEKGATLEAVQLMRKHLPAEVAIKASGGIRDFAFASALLQAGASRLGTSGGIAIIHGAQNQHDY